MGHYSKKSVMDNRVFYRKMVRNFIFGIIAMGFSLLIGMIGYHYLENLNWLDSYLNASMILSGMGQIEPLKTPEGKLFAATYALFAGTVFLLVIAIVFAPFVHRLFLKFHLEDEGSG